jgi:hypothetical protein
VVRMRDKKSARARKDEGGGIKNNKFEQRITQILESLQAEAASLMRLQQNIEVENGNGERYWTQKPL